MCYPDDHEPLTWREVIAWVVLFAAIPLLALLGRLFR